jgi:hypothetical protein
VKDYIGSNTFAKYLESQDCRYLTVIGTDGIRWVLWAKDVRSRETKEAIAPWRSRLSVSADATFRVLDPDQPARLVRRDGLELVDRLEGLPDSPGVSSRQESRSTSRERRDSNSRSGYPFVKEGRLYKKALLVLQEYWVLYTILK